MVRPQPLPPRITDEERVAHRAFVATLGASPVWLEYPRATPDDRSVA
jgi:DNA polymerase-3 subunit epsilon